MRLMFPRRWLLLGCRGCCLSVVGRELMVGFKGGSTGLDKGSGVARSEWIGVGFLELHTLQVVHIMKDLSTHDMTYTILGKAS
ncbi:hypothetical protein E3N88_12099 [Mikania micrantha]|uniref:Secreted protein n=1 Tax=Mikania micrantha TaxID=192012 RepID=A0A5N6P4I8_9ASTR|nr:hypothetical protein E3N88_12099 [Mikania micrantha]